MVSVGVVDKLSVYFDSIRGPLAANCEAGDFVQHGLALLISLIRLLSKRYLKTCHRLNFIRCL